MEFDKITELVLNDKQEYIKVIDNNDEKTEDIKYEEPKTLDEKELDEKTNNINHIIDVDETHTALLEIGKFWTQQANGIYKTNLVGLKLLVNEGDNITFIMQGNNTTQYVRSIDIDADHWKYWKKAQDGLYYLMLEVDNLCFDLNPDYPYIILIGMLGVSKDNIRQVIIMGMCFADLEFYDKSNMTDSTIVLTLESNEKYKYMDYTKVFPNDSIFIQ